MEKVFESVDRACRTHLRSAVSQRLFMVSAADFDSRLDAVRRRVSGIRHAQLRYSPNSVS
jgi:hypothetical protein